MSTGVNGWHPGELAIQRKLNFDGPAVHLWRYIQPEMDEYHSDYYVSEAPFTLVTVLDNDLRPWGSVLPGRDERASSLKVPNSQTILADARLWDGDPMVDVLASFGNETSRTSKQYRYLMAGVGIEFRTRRRHKFAGYMRGAKNKGGCDYALDLAVDQSLANCPKYISIREFTRHPNPNPRVEFRVLEMGPNDELPQTVIDIIHATDTMFLATVYKARTEDASRFPSHAGMNHRGGHPGFIRVRPSDRRTLVVPDYSGNRHLSSLGNIQTTGLAGITIIDFSSGDVLYLTGEATNVVGDAAQELMPRQAALTTLRVTGYVLVRNALPLRERAGSLTPSPYSPPIKYLREENREIAFAPGPMPNARLAKVSIHADDLATLEFELSPNEKALEVRPGQAIALDFTKLLGRPAYAHMAPFAPKSINDDRVRTWTVASAHEGAGARHFSMTMRRKPSGVVTGALFAIAHKLRDARPELLADARALALDVGIVGITGEFALPPPATSTKLLFAAGGIGITPFLSMLAALAARGPGTQADVVLALSTREPTVFVSLVRAALGNSPPPGIRVQLDVFTHTDILAFEHDMMPRSPGLVATWYKGRIPSEYWVGVAEGREAFVCGPNEFGNAVGKAIREAGVPKDNIYREGFAY
ncbi:hypothetical protein K488DRAFT_88327 [Vararia minispora EC-137]|uniref:Uncharacterized protein n=1 Tax=Vararia minispora EC-137 TaxID=1314806 RepID=A0ACB8QE54_9AGAM|nr:hypothetical protein K488DRAFT_88327 [Vararia minispora EC-137]